jgi:hypothetical protein
MGAFLFVLGVVLGVAGDPQVDAFTLESAFAFLQRTGLLGSLVVCFYLHRFVRPWAVEVVGLVRASAKKLGVTDDDIKAGHAQAELDVPDPVDSVGVAGKLMKMSDLIETKNKNGGAS